MLGRYGAVPHRDIVMHHSMCLIYPSTLSILDAPDSKYNALSCLAIASPMAGLLTSLAASLVEEYEDLKR